MSTPLDFLSSLQAGDLVAATTSSSSKLHLIHIVRQVTVDMCKGQPDAKTLQTLVDGRVLCELRSRFYWKPTDEHEHWKGESKCRWCYSKWRAAGRPAIKGWAKVEAPIVSSIRLPWGWHEVSPTGHPLDLAADAPEPDPDDDENEVGWKRTEVKRWIRGPRYVRITQATGDKRFCVHLGELESNDEQWNLKAGWDAALLRALMLMAQGGGGRTTSKAITLKDVGAA